MKKITTLLTAIIGMALMNQVSATHVTVEVPTAGQLNSLIQDANCDSITISGNLNGNDFRFIQNNMPNLIYLNIAKVIIPDNKIPSSGLQSKTTLQQIILPDNVETIGEYAFDRCSNLKKVTFPKTLTTILTQAFSECALSGELKLPTITTHIGELAFDYNQITKAVLPDSLKTIGSEAFRGCQLLQEVVFPEKLTTIGQYAFYDCIRLHTGTLKSKTPPEIFNQTFNYTKTFYVPEGSGDVYSKSPNWSNLIVINGSTPRKATVTLTAAGTLGEEILKQVDYVTDVNELVINGPLNDDDFYQIKQRTTHLISIDMTGATIESLPESFFYERAALLDIKLPATLKSIGRYAFYRCYGLTQITIPEGATSIKDHSFEQCLSLKEI